MQNMIGLINSHTHSPHGPHYKGAIHSQSFETFMVDCTARYTHTETTDEAIAFALVTGLENLMVGNTAIIDQALVSLTKDRYHGIAQAYEDLGLRAWVFTEVSDLPFSIYTREGYPNFRDAIPFHNLPKDLQEMCAMNVDYRDLLSSIESIIQEWTGNLVRIGVGLDNPVWCSDELLIGAASIARKFDVPICFHAEESAIQRKVHKDQWKMSSIERAAKFGLLTPQTLVVHAVNVDAKDIAILAESGCSISHNPISNLKLRNGIAPLGQMISAGINICLGSDGSSSGDSQSIFQVMKFVSALAEFNGLADIPGLVEELVIVMATKNGNRFWLDEDLSGDYIEFSSPLGPYGAIWDDPDQKIKEVYIGGRPRLNHARELVRERCADQIVSAWAQNIIDEKCGEHARLLVNWTEQQTQSW